MKNPNKILTKGVPILAFAILAIALAVLGYQYWNLNSQYELLKGSKSTIEETLRTTQEALALIESEKLGLQDELLGEKQKVEEFGEQVEDIAETVGMLDKLSKIDPELLQKYSKVFFLNEHYVPSSLSSIPTEYKWNEDQNLQMHTAVLPYLEDMLADAVDEDVDMYVLSAYRSFGTQSALKAGYTVSYGSGANQFSADQGYSEHQLGTTIDLTVVGIGATLGGFDQTEAYTWLQENAYRYGFVLSYPKGNAYYIFEPWHWRFVGKDLARKLHREDNNFYDLDQRVIDEYLISFFD